MSGAHASRAPSAAHRWMECPGSVARCWDYPDSDTVFSREGTFAHDIAAHTLEHDLDHVADLIGVGNTTDLGKEFTLDTEMAAYLQIYVDAVRSKTLLERTTVMIEKKVTLLPDVHGTGDALVWHPRHLDIFDLKYGAGIFVEVEENEQEMIYALAALNTYPELAANVETITLHIVQPRRTDAEGEAWRSWTTTVVALEGWLEAKLKPAVDLTYTDNAPLKPGDHCRFCDDKGKCPALRQQALQVAQEVFPPLDTPPNPRDMEPADIGRVLGAADVVETWLKAVREHALDTMRAGNEIPGYKLVETIANRRWRDPDAAQAKLTECCVDPFAERKLVTPAEADRRLGRGAKRITSALTHRPVTGNTLAKLEDTRPLLNPGQVFADLD